MPFFQQKTSYHTRSGLSFVEFVGCLAALGGGLVLGLFYLGFDVKTMAVEALEQSKIVDTSYFAVTAAQDEALADEPAPSDAEQGELTAEVPSTAKTNTEPTTSPSSNDTTEPQNESDDSPRETTEVEPGIAAQNYWKLLTHPMRAEAVRRKEIFASSGDWLLFDHLMHRKTGHEQAVEALEKLEDANVDPRLVAHAHQVLSWHRAGEQLYSRAVDLLTDGPTASFEGPSAQSWQSSATQLRMEEKLLREKHIGVAGYLSLTYKPQAPFLPAVTP